MSLSVTAEIQGKDPFVLNATSVEKLWRLSEKHIGVTVAKAACQDGIERNFESLEALLAYENSRSGAIKQLELTSRIQGGELRSTITLGSSLFGNISARASGPEDAIVIWRFKIVEILDGLRPWYRAITKIDFSNVMFTVMVLLWIVISMMSMGAASPKSVSFAEAAKATGILVAFFGLVTIVSTTLNRLRDRYFPMAFFAIGQGEERFRTDENVRWVVIVGFVVSTISSLLIAL